MSILSPTLSFERFVRFVFHGNKTIGYLTGDHRSSSDNFVTVRVQLKNLKSNLIYIPGLVKLWPVPQFDKTRCDSPASLTNRNKIT